MTSTGVFYAWQVQMPSDVPGDDVPLHHTLVASMHGQPPGALAGESLAEVLPMQPVAQQAADQVGAHVVLRVFSVATELCALQPRLVQTDIDASDIVRRFEASPG